MFATGVGKSGIVGRRLAAAVVSHALLHSKSLLTGSTELVRIPHRVCRGERVAARRSWQAECGRSGTRSPVEVAGTDCSAQVVLLSHSGETGELLDVLGHLHNKGALTTVVVGRCPPPTSPALLRDGTSPQGALQPGHGLWLGNHRCARRRQSGHARRANSLHHRPGAVGLLMRHGDACAQEAVVNALLAELAASLPNPKQTFVGNHPGCTTTARSSDDIICSGGAIGKQRPLA